MASVPPPWFPIQTARLRLRPFEKGDLDDVHAYASDLDTVRFMDWGPNTPEVTAERLRIALEEQAAWPRPEVSLAVEAAEAGRVIGSVRLGLDRAGGADFGYVLGSPWWRRGYAYEAASALLAVAFGALELHRVWATCDARNLGSIALLEKLGLRREGLLRHDRRGRDGWRDTCVYAVLREEWAGR